MNSFGRRRLIFSHGERGCIESDVILSKICNFACKSRQQDLKMLFVPFNKWKHFQCPLKPNDQHLPFKLDICQVKGINSMCNCFESFEMRWWPTTLFTFPFVKSFLGQVEMLQSWPDMCHFQGSTRFDLLHQIRSQTISIIQHDLIQFLHSTSCQWNFQYFGNVV